jgi:hypothetical protein
VAVACNLGRVVAAHMTQGTRMNRTLVNRRSLTGLMGVAAACLLPVLAPSPARAETAGGDDWQWNATLYAWLPSLGGETSFPPSGEGPSIDVSIDTILDSLNFVFMGAFEGRKGAWGFTTDVIYLDLGAHDEATREFGIGAVIPATVDADLRLDMTAWAWTLAGTYAVVQQDGLTVNLLAGTRMLELEEQLKWQFNGDISELPVVERSGSASAKDTQWDAIVGVKGRWIFGDDRQWYVPYYLDVGAGESDLTWQGMAGLGYSFNSVDLTAAWRYLDYDLGESTPIKSIDLSGPALGVTFRF